MAYTKKNKQIEPSSPALIAFQVSERGEKAFWSRIGAAWKHEDGKGLTLQLDAVPAASGRIVLRAPRQNEAGA